MKQENDKWTVDWVEVAERQVTVAYLVPGDPVRRGGYLNVTVPWLRTPWYYYQLVFNRLHPQKRLFCPVDEWRRLMGALS